MKEAKLAMQLVEPVLLVTDETCVSWCIDVQNTDIPSLKWRVLMEESTSTSEHKQCMICVYKHFNTSQRLEDNASDLLIVLLPGSFDNRDA